MPGLGVEEYQETDSSDNEENHSKLLSSISQLDSAQRVKPAQRKEAALKVSEYNLTERIPSKKNLISVNELANVLGKSSKHGVITKKLKNVISKSKTLPKPLKKPLEEQIIRSIGFENVKNQLGRWDSVVTRNALKDQMKFPLNCHSVVMQKSEEFLTNFQSSTPLEEEIMKVLKQENKEEKQEDKNEKQEDKEFLLTMEEMLEKRREMAYLRAKLSYREAKALRQNKIKSKKYHRILKREKLRQQLKEFEHLQKTDPEAALKKLSELDKTRAQERASLRHRNTGHWAKNLSVRAKYDVESRKILAEQLKISRELTQKVCELDDSDKEEPEELTWNDLKENVKLKLSNKFEENPWNVNVSKEVQDFVSGYKKYWNEQNKTEDANNKQSEEHQEKNIEKIEKVDKDSFNSNAEIQEPLQSDMAKPVKNKNKPETSNILKRSKSVSIYPGSGVWIVTPFSDKSEVKVKKKRKINDIDTLFEELDEQLMENAKLKAKKLKNNLKDKKNKKKSTPNKNIEVEFDLSLKNKSTVERPDMDEGLLEGDEISLKYQPNGNAVSQTEKVNASKKITEDIDPDKYIQVKPKRLRTQLPENITNGEDNLDVEEQHRMTIEEAFVDDDVIAEFKEMKGDAEKSQQIDIETSLPGWGQWGGSGIIPKRKKPLLVVNLPLKKEKEKEDTIINENANPNLKNHLVKEIPHPFKSVEAFEANIRAPVGREWVPETAHWKLIQKQVETKLGAVIDPMDEDEIVRQKKNHKSPYQGKRKNKEKTIR